MSVTWFHEYVNKLREQVGRPDDKHSAGLSVLCDEDRAAALDEFDMKVSHTLLVRDRCEDIARWLGLTGHAFTLASLCGLYHDLGRFVQAVRFGTMDDRITGSHADMSEQVFGHDVPHDGLSPHDVNIIATALRCHNLFKIPNNISGEALLYARLTRDADKLDIFRHVIDMNNGKEQRVFRMVQYDTVGDINPELYGAVMRGENINASKVRTREDRMLLELSLIYDLNFGASFQQTLDMHFVEQLTGTDKRVESAAAYAIQYMRERVDMGKMRT